VAKSTLSSLGIRKSAVPLLNHFLDVNQRLNQIRSVSAGAGSGEESVSRRFAGSRAPKSAKPKNGKAHAAKAKSAASQFHEVRRLLDERAFYPAHDARKESSAYAKVHKQLVTKHGCLICGVTNDVLTDPKRKLDLRLHPYAAKQLETHHHVIEWALANAIDPNKFNKLVFPHLKARHADRYKDPLTPQQVKDWVDHSEDNLWVLCDVHHRAKWFGIHEITDPLWGPQDIFDDGYLAKVREAIGKDTAKPGVRAGKGIVNKKNRSRVQPVAPAASAAAA